MSELRGHQFLKSAKLQESIDGAIAELKEHSSKINSIKGPDKEHEASHQQLVDDIAKYRGRPLFYPYIGTGLGNGPYVELEDGSVKMDLINGIGVHIQGHSHPQVTRAILEGGMADVLNHGNLQANKEYLFLKKKLVELAKGSNLKHAWLTTCGTMANENALKMARQKNSPARKIISMGKAFAGRSTMMAEVTDNPAYKQGLPDYNEVLRVPFCNKFDANMCKTSCGKDTAFNTLKKHIEENKGDIAAFVFEPILGEGGYQVPCSEFFLPMLKLCKENGIAVWADEVQTFLRTGQPYAFQTLGFGEYVDIVTIAKTAQLGATLFTEEYAPKPGLVAGTFAGTTPAMRAGLEIIDIMETQNFFGEKGRTMQIGKRFEEGLKKLEAGSCKGMISDIVTQGMMVAYTPGDGEKQTMIDYLKVLYKNGIITLGCGRGPFRARFLIPMVITDEQIDEAVSVMEKSLLELKELKV